MHNLTEQELLELLEMGIDPSSVVSAYDQADFGTFVDNTVGKVKNFFGTQTPVDPAAPSQGGTAFSLTGGKGVSAFDEIIPQKQMQRPDQPTQYKMTSSGAPTVTTPQSTTFFERLDTKLNNKVSDLEKKYKDKIVDKDGKPKAYKFLDKPMQGLMAGISYGAGMNQTAQVQEQNRLANQTPFKEAGNTKEYYDHDFVGENDPLFFLNSRDGAKAEAQPMYAPGGVPIEAEGGEFYLDPSTGATLPIHGPSHEEGGVKMVAESGSYIMSDNVKIPGSYVNDMLKKNVLPPKKQYTISDVIRQFPQHFDTKGDAEKLNDRSLDPIAKNSFEMNMKKKLGNVSKLLAYQQQMNGGHGEDKGPEARYGMEINGGQPLSFDYRPDELRVKDMQQMQQPPTARRGNRNEQPVDPTQLSKDQLAAINKLVKKGTLTQSQADIIRTAKVKPDGSLDLTYSPQIESIPQNVLQQAAYALGNKSIGFSNIPANVKTVYGQNVSATPGTEKKQYYDKVSNKRFDSLDEYKAYKEANPQIYKDYGAKLEHYTTQEDYYKGQDKLFERAEAENILKEFDDDGDLSRFVYKPESILGADGKPDLEKVARLTKAFNSVQGTGADGKRQFQYTTKDGKIATITQGGTEGYSRFKDETKKSKTGFFGGITPDVAAAYYVYQTYGKDAYDQYKDNPQELKNIWGKEALGLNEEDLKSDAWTSGKFFDSDWVSKNEATMPAGLRKALGNDQMFGFDHMDPRVRKALNIDPTEEIIPGVGQMQIDPTPPQTKRKPPKERLPLGQYLGLLPSPRTQNYLPEYRQERYEPNLVSLRSAKNDQVAAMNSMLQQQGANPATMSARQASLYGDAAKNIGAITEQENNTNAQILNQAKAQNAQMANQIQGLQQQANHQYVTENAQDLAALDADRYQKLSDLYSAQQKVNQYNKTLKFIDDNMAKNMDLTVDSEGNVKVTRNDEKASFTPPTQNAQTISKLNATLNTATPSQTQSTEQQAPGNNPTNPASNATKPQTNRTGGAIKKRSRLII